jgi:hypothetical protein
MFGNAPVGFYAIGALGALLMYAAIIAFVASKRHRKTRYYQRRSDQHKSKSDHDANRFGIAEEHDAVTNNQDQNSYTLERDGYDIITIGLGIAGLIAVIYYTAISYSLYSVTRESLVDVQRAFISETDIEVFRGVANLQGIGNGNLAQGAVVVRFENAGSSPGINVVENMNACVANPDILPSNFSYRDLSDINLHHHAYIAPKTNFISYNPLTSQQAAEVIGIQSALYVWGWITYDDIFGQHHRSEYCGKYQGFMTMPNNKLTWIADQCNPKNPHSCTDKNCPDKWGNDDVIKCENHP